MKKLSVVMLTLLFLFTSCETLDNISDSISDLISGGKKTEEPSDSKETKISTPKYKRENIDTTIWDLSILDTARDVDYMDEIEKDVVLEMNMARTNPKKYAELYIEPRKKSSNKNI